MTSVLVMAIMSDGTHRATSTPYAHRAKQLMNKWVAEGVDVVTLIDMTTATVTQTL